MKDSGEQPQPSLSIEERLNLAEEALELSLGYLARSWRYNLGKPFTLPTLVRFFNRQARYQDRYLRYFDLELTELSTYAEAPVQITAQWLVDTLTNDRHRRISRAVRDPYLFEARSEHRGDRPKVEYYDNEYTGGLWLECFTSPQAELLSRPEQISFATKSCLQIQMAAEFNMLNHSAAIVHPIEQRLE